MHGGDERADDRATGGGRTGATMVDGDELVDADALLGLTAQLRAARARVERAAVGADRRRRWQYTLAAIAEGATQDLDRAHAQLRRLVAQLDRADVD